MNAFEMLKRANADKAYQLLDWTDIHKKQLMNEFPDWDGSLRSLSQKELMVFIKRAKL